MLWWLAVFPITSPDFSYMTGCLNKVPQFLLLSFWTIKNSTIKLAINPFHILSIYNGHCITSACVLMWTKLSNVTVAVLFVHKRQAELKLSFGNVIVFISTLIECTKDVVTDVHTLYTVVVLLLTQLQPCSEELESMSSKFEWLPTLAVFFLR